MRFHLGLCLLGITLIELVGPGTAAAATANCMNPDGSCEVSNDGMDFTSCECADGTGVAGGGGNAWAGLSELELQPICEEQLAMFCGPVMPPDGIPCASPAGSCIIDNDPEDSLGCECADGSGGGFAGGNAWAGLSDMELLMQCEQELAVLCGGAPPPPPPPPPALECSSRLGACSIASEPLDFLVCECADGNAFEGGGGNDWAGLSEEELLMICEEALADGCAAGGETGGEGTGGEETGGAGSEGTGGEGTGGEGTGGEGTGEPGETGVDDSGGASEGSGGEGPEPATTGDDATGGGSEGTGGEGDGGGSGGGGSCSIAPRSTPSGLALALLGLLGVGWRRRRAA